MDLVAGNMCISWPPVGKIALVITFVISYVVTLLSDGKLKIQDSSCSHQ